MARFAGFTGPSYTSLSPAVALERTGNFYCEAVEVSATGKTDLALYSRPGSAAFAAPPSFVAQPVRAQSQYDGNGVPTGAVFGVSGNQFWQLAPDGSQSVWGEVEDDGSPAQIVQNAATVGQVAVSSAGHLYVLSGGVFAEIANDGVNFFGSRGIAFIDGYLVVLSLTANQQQFQISALNEMRQIDLPNGAGKSWNGANVAILEGQADPIAAVAVTVEYIYFLGKRRGEIWYNTGNALFPFAIESGAFIEMGTNAPASVCQAQGVVFWLGQDARGANTAQRIDGLAAVRISTHAVEAAWAQYSTTDDCICYPITWNGHSLIRYIFPTADKGWEYDLTETAKLGEPVWTEIYFTDLNGNQHAPFERAHCYAFGKHLIGSGGADGCPGAIYAIDGATYADAVGSPYGQIVNPAGTASLITEVGPSDVGLFVNDFASLPATYPFYLQLGGQELCLCTAGIAIGSTLTVKRGQGGTAAETWAVNATVQSVTLAGFPLTRDRIVRLPYNGNRRMFLDRLEFLIQAGVGIAYGQGSDPVLLVRISRDGGNTWGREIRIPMGKGGQYLERVIANRLGSYRDGAIWIRITDPVFVAIAGAEYYAREGAS